MSKRYKVGSNFVVKMNDLVSSCKWDSVEKSIDLEVSDNQIMDVFRWIEHIRVKHSQFEKSPFNENDNTFFYIDVFDHNEKPSFKAMFNELSIESHQCFFGEEQIKHTIKLKYLSLSLFWHESICHYDKMVCQDCNGT